MPKVAPSAPFVDPSLLLCLRADYTCMYAQFEPGNEWNSSEADPELQTQILCPLIFELCPLKTLKETAFLLELENQNTA